MFTKGMILTLVDPPTRTDCESSIGFKTIEILDVRPHGAYYLPAQKRKPRPHESEAQLAGKWFYLWEYVTWCTGASDGSEMSMSFFDSTGGDSGNDLSDECLAGLYRVTSR